MLFRRRMTRRQLLEALTVRAQHAEQIFGGCLESQGLDRSSDYTLWAQGTRLAYSEALGCRLMLTTALTGETEGSITGYLADRLARSEITVKELLERYR